MTKSNAPTKFEQNFGLYTTKTHSLEKLYLQKLLYFMMAKKGDKHQKNFIQQTFVCLVIYAQLHIKPNSQQVCIYFKPNSQKACTYSKQLHTQLLYVHIKQNISIKKIRRLKCQYIDTSVVNYSFFQQIVPKSRLQVRNKNIKLQQNNLRTFLKTNRIKSLYNSADFSVPNKIKQDDQHKLDINMLRDVCFFNWDMINRTMIKSSFIVIIVLIISQLQSSPI
eukprot:TRINITY_DN3749_c0_g1_i4.p1 TRINITY_DN3749_c0_g1~~TRINITY_DN3749_c0_g1_i4.p1  ORF type:complete len:222 (+),score=-14.83 TRINITY_DN3749_c0_g1_i4:528-1193(+)